MTLHCVLGLCSNYYLQMIVDAHKSIHVCFLMAPGSFAAGYTNVS